MDVKPLRRMRVKCRICKRPFLTERRKRYRQTCSRLCNTTWQEQIKADAALPKCAVCNEPMERVRKGRQNSTCGAACRNILLKRHRDAQASGADVEGDGPDPLDPTLPLRIAEFYREQAELRWTSANRRRIRIID
jgi:endogenous inhibitor of DNA gyrase (YacG/DUF329 family)